MNHSVKQLASTLESADPVPARLLDVLQQRSVRPVYQPIVNLTSADIVGYESLTRVDPATGFESVADLFDTASACGMLWDLELLTRRASIETPPSWPLGKLLFLNCNPKVAADSRFADAFLEIINASGVCKPSNIVLEITERAETQFTSGLAEQVSKVREHGVQIAIDDLGAGTSGLQRIMELRPDWLKLDRDLVANLDRDPFKQNLIDVLLRLTRVSGARLVAEGVERQEEITALLDLGVQYVQGYLLGRPESTLQGIDTSVQSWVLSEVDRVVTRRVTQHLTFLSGIVRQAPLCESDASIERVAELLNDSPATPGVIVLRGGSPIGWLSRQRAEELEQDGLSTPIASIMQPTSPPAPSTTLVSEALLYLSTRSAGIDSAPIVVERDGEIVGVVPVDALLREASRLTAIADSSYAEVSGLPGRVKTDQRLQEIIRRDQDGFVLFIDIRDFHNYNLQQGYELGDLLLRILAGVLISTVESACGGEQCFAGHLGDDRFIVVMDDGNMNEVVQQIVEDFEFSSDRFVSCSTARKGGDNSSKSAAGLRIIGVQLRQGQFTTLRELHGCATRARTEIHPLSLGRSHYLSPIDTDRVPHRRKSA